MHTALCLVVIGRCINVHKAVDAAVIPTVVAVVVVAFPITTTVSSVAGVAIVVIVVIADDGCVVSFENKSVGAAAIDVIIFVAADVDLV